MRCISSVSLRKRDQERVAIKAVAIFDVQTFDNPVLRDPNLGLQLHALDHDQDGASGHSMARRDINSGVCSPQSRNRAGMSIGSLYAGYSADPIDVSARTRPAAHLDIDHVAVH